MKSNGKLIGGNLNFKFEKTWWSHDKNKKFTIFFLLSFNAKIMIVIVYTFYYALQIYHAMYKLDEKT